MKRFLTLALIAFIVLHALSGCGSAGNVIDYDLVFVNCSDSTVVEVVLDFIDQTSGGRRADSCPMKRGETFGFEAGEYPVTVAVYDRTVDSREMEPGEIARIVIPEAPPEGKRWYVTAQDGEQGLNLTVDTICPEEAEKWAAP